MSMRCFPGLIIIIIIIIIIINGKMKVWTLFSIGRLMQKINNN